MRFQFFLAFLFLSFFFLSCLLFVCLCRQRADARHCADGLGRGGSARRHSLRRRGGGLLDAYWRRVSGEWKEAVGQDGDFAGLHAADWPRQYLPLQPPDSGCQAEENPPNAPGERHCPRRRSGCQRRQHLRHSARARILCLFQRGRGKCKKKGFRRPIIIIIYHLSFIIIIIILFFIIIILFFLSFLLFFSFLLLFFFWRTC